MNIIREKNDQELTLCVEGEINSATAGELEEVIKNELSEVKSLIFDFAKLEYLSSAGLRVLLVAQKIMQKKGQMVIRHVNKGVSDIFKITGFYNVLNIED